MIHAEDILIMDKNFNLENTIIENDVLKRNNRALKNTLVIALVTVIGILIAISVAKRLQKKTEQRV
ncbi:MAG: hypothetical protein KA210_05345 [Bacteroidia bacterium]|nr:hypothetical protein [Bacteroidia bacterium]